MITATTELVAIGPGHPDFQQVEVVRSDIGFGSTVRCSVNRQWACRINGTYLRTSSGSVRTFGSFKAAERALAKAYGYPTSLQRTGRDNWSNC